MSPGLTICLSALELVKKRCRRCPLICLSAVKEVIKALLHRPFDLFLACSKEVKNCSPVTILICLSAMKKRAQDLRRVFSTQADLFAGSGRPLKTFKACIHKSLCRHLISLKRRSGPSVLICLRMKRDVKGKRASMIDLFPSENSCVSQIHS